MIKNTVIIILLIALIGVSWLFYRSLNQFEPEIVYHFDSCVDLGGSVLDTNPKQCQYREISYIEDVNIVEPINENAQPAGSEEDLLQMLNMPTEEARALARQFNRQFRVVEEDEIAFAVTMDYIPGRINAIIENGVVVDYTIE